MIDILIYLNTTGLWCMKFEVRTAQTLRADGTGKKPVGYLKHIKLKIRSSNGIKENSKLV